MHNDPPRPKRRSLRRAFVAGGLVLALTAGGTVWWASDRFLIPHVEVADVGPGESWTASRPFEITIAPGELTD